MGWFDRRLALLSARGATPAELAALVERVRDLAVCTEDAFLLNVGAAVGGKAATPPEEVQVFKEGQWLEYPKEGGLTLTRKHFEQVIANHARYGTDPVVDREHESVWSFETTAAQGWVKSMRIGVDAKDATKAALFATVEWTPPGEEWVGQKLGRYISGGIFLNSKDRNTSEPVGARLDHIAVCCKPFIDGMRPLTNSVSGGAGRDNPNEGESMNKELQKVLCGLLGLGEGADEAAILKALQDKEGVIRASLSGRTSTLLLSTAAFAALRLEPTATAEAISLRVVELGAREGQLAELSTKVAQLEGDKLTAEVEAAITAGKYTPAEREVQLKVARKDPELWREQTKLRAVQTPGGAPVETAGGKRGEGGGTNGGVQLSSTEKKRLDAVDAYLKANPSAGYPEAVAACARANPTLFSSVIPEEG